MYFEVVAQGRVTIMTYKLEVEVLSSDAFVVSSVYEVDQENLEISGLADATSVSLFESNIEVVTGATATILSKLGHERSVGGMYFDDVLKVVSQDGSKTITYFLTFLNEENPDANLAPQVTLAFTDTNMVDVGTIMLKATATDDGLPPPPALTYMWKVTLGTPETVVIENENALETNVTFNAKGGYILTLSVSDGALMSEASVNMSVGASNVGKILEPAIRVYPNPATEKLTLELINMPGRSSLVSMYDITGSLVYNRKLALTRTELDISNFDAGFYFIKVVSEDQTFTQRVEIH